MAYLLVVHACFFAICIVKGLPAVVLVPAWQKLEGYVKDVLAEQMGTSLFFALFIFISLIKVIATSA